MLGSEGANHEVSQLVCVCINFEHIQCKMSSNKCTKINCMKHLQSFRTVFSRTTKRYKADIKTLCR